jgi:hypothetical protein
VLRSRLVPGIRTVRDHCFREEDVHCPAMVQVQR